MLSSGTSVCIVGAGPRGTSVLERICANSTVLSTSDAPVVVHLVDPFPPGAGGVWRTDQPAHLLMNTVSSQVSLFTDDSVACAGPVVEGPSLYEWAKQLVGPDDPGEVRAQARALGPDSYPSRALYGHYLEWVFRRLVRTAPVGLTITVHRRSAVRLGDGPDGQQVVTLDDGTRLSVDSVVLALGHGPVRLTEEETRLRDFAVDHDLTYIPPSNPADIDLNRAQAGERVALRGMGLNFFDYLALFTETRGGRFERGREGLVYLPSGREPLLYAGSRRGVPHHARGENEKGALGRHEPAFLTEQVVAGLRRRSAAGFRLTFMRDVWPLIDKEVRTVYYHALVAARGDGASAAEFRREYLACQHADSDDTALLRRFGIDAAQRWDWDRIARPYGDQEFSDRAQFHDWLLEYLRNDAAEARRGNVHGPLKAALDTLRDLRNEVRLVVDHGGITGRSYRDELARWYTPLNAFLSIGPPLRRIEEMMALVEAGVLRAIGPGMRVTPAHDGSAFLVDATSVHEPAVEVTTLIEARIPDVDLRRSDNPLLRHLLATGQARTYRIPDENGADFESGGLAVTDSPYRLVDDRHRPHPRRFAYGVPTEYVHWVTAAGIRPGVGSVTLTDSDAIARAVLTVATRQPAAGAAPVRSRTAYAAS
ncbi:MAG TPA: FAD/NAD(P)-binding protein [Pseudonocardiaceae bacterium]|jgi:uncharacterized NAD(P)/FAD-binding protein YdhS|nr:FAD/NAD(P)-binding protein [Pseudonocardiaceae bacterium]